MDAKLEKVLVDKYPDLFVDYGGDMGKTCMTWGCAHGDGWFKILEELCEGLSKIKGVKFTQIKEKFGGLRVYLNAYNEEAEKLIGIADFKSYHTCELCGEPGGPTQAGWIRTLCPDCYRKGK